MAGVERKPQLRGAPVASATEFHRVLAVKGERALEDIGWCPEDNLLNNGYELDKEHSRGRLTVFRAPMDVVKAAEKKAADTSIARLNESANNANDKQTKNVIKMERGEVRPSDVIGPLDMEDDDDLGDDPSLRM